ncbi:MAG: phosphate ABC transporter permease subunit PstC [Bdellovibrionales bacterium]|nr:phosphate ABC transporter permease subunit PstC [Bdellovibrionales bacterium]
MSKAVALEVSQTVEAGPVKKRDLHLGDRVFFWILRGVATSVILLLAALTLYLFRLSIPAFQTFGAKFLISLEWNPVSEVFGAGPFIYGTVVSSLLALCISVPVSLGVSLFLNELAPKKLADTMGFLVEMLAAIPSVVYGLWGIFVLAPWLRTTVQPLLGKTFGFIPLFQGPPFGVGMLAAGLVLAIMITPTISAICKEVFRAIPDHQREASLALGATRWEMIHMSVIQTARSGILGAVILGLGRAMGETMAVTMVIGNRAEIDISLFAPAQTMASVIANEYAEASSQIHLSSLAAVGLSLFVVSLLINAMARFVVHRVDSRSAKAAH